MEKEIENIKCPKCGTVAIKGTKKCIKCHTTLESNLKSCPKCAKRNDINANKCVSCGYNFNKKHRSILFNIIISILIVVVLFLLVGLEYTGIVSKVNFFAKVVAIILLLIILYSNINYGYKDIVKYEKLESPNSEEMNKKIKKMKRTSSILIIIASIVILVCLIIYYLANR